MIWNVIKKDNADDDRVDDGTESAGSFPTTQGLIEFMWKDHLNK